MLKQYFNISENSSRFYIKQIFLCENKPLFYKPAYSVIIPDVDVTDVYVIMLNNTFFLLQDKQKEQSLFTYVFYNTEEAMCLEVALKETLSVITIFNYAFNEFGYKNYIYQEMKGYVPNYPFIKINNTFRSHQVCSATQQQLQIIVNHHKLVENYFREKNSVTQYTALLLKSPSPLVRAHMTLGAKQLLLNTTKTTEKISHELRFNYPRYFSKFFEIQFTESPIKYYNTCTSKKFMN